ncbi:MAG: hypothetical protein ACE5E1_02450 [Phycisphaerae bacterium]
MINSRWVALFFATVAALAATAHDPAPAEPTATRPAAKSDRAAGLEADRERRFKAMLTDVVLRGTWRMTGAEGLKGQGPLTPPRPERYHIRRVSKGLGDHWVITARITYADKDFEVPISVRVVWAEDTPIITVKDWKIPGVGPYSARVMFYRGFYAGTWFGSNYGGVLSGRIIPAADEPAAGKDARKKQTNQQRLE